MTQEVDHAPTPRQQLVWDTVERTGSQVAAAAELGMTQAGVRSAMTKYQDHHGIVGPLPGARLRPNLRKRGTGELATLRHRVADLTRQLERCNGARDLLELQVTELLDERAAWPATIQDMLQQLLDRPAGVQVSHRRIVDGGTHPRHQRRGGT